MNNRKQRRYQEKIKRKVAHESPFMEFQGQPTILQSVGPIIETDVGITDEHAEALRQAGIEPPNPIRCRLLIDTGASRSLVKHEIASKAGLKLISSNYPIHGVGVDTTGKIYVGRIWFICKSVIDESVTHNIWVDTQIASGTLHASDVLDGLIGRDVLHHFEFIYNGKTGRFTLKYFRPT